MTLDRPRLVRGEELGITVSVFPDIRQRSLSGSSSCLTGYSVLDASGVVVAPRDWICTADLVNVHIPSDGIIRHFTWQGRTESGTEGEPLPAGVYRIIGGPGPSGRSVGSLSPAVTVELVEP